MDRIGSWQETIITINQIKSYINLIKFEHSNERIVVSMKKKNVLENT